MTSIDNSISDEGKAHMYSLFALKDDFSNGKDIKQIMNKVMYTFGVYMPKDGGKW